MAGNSEKMLLVEGIADQSFFESIFHDIGYKNKEISVGPPREYGAAGNGKGNAIKIFEDLLDGIRDARIKRLGLVTDADFSKTSGLGFLATYQRIAAPLIAHNYIVPSTPEKVGSSGFVFKHQYDLPDIGVWIMPSNQSDGYIEDFCLQSAVKSESQLLTKARQAVSQLSSPKFPTHFNSKAEAATWLAWQAVPGQGLTGLIGNSLLDKEDAKSSYAGLRNW